MLYSDKRFKHKGLKMSKFGMVHARLPEELMRKYKVFCAMNDMSITAQTEHIIREFIKNSATKIKIIKTN